MITLADLEEEWPDELTPETERNPQTHFQRQWANDGYVIIPDLIDEHKMRKYEAEWLEYNADRPGGYPYATPYMDYPEMMSLATDSYIAAALHMLIGEPMGVHLNLSGWVSTRRDWHRDQYLNEPGVGDFYAAVWISLGQVHADAGPFEFIPGSHKAKPISQQKMREALGDEGHGPDWPSASEKILTPLFEPIVSRGRVKQFMGQRGDVLIWHGRLLHRGSVPTNPNAERRSLICHYSGIDHRPDMPPAVKSPAGGWYFPLAGRQPTRYQT